jgi:hypothetical protein
MANVKNKWIGYLDRSYDQITSALLEKVTLSNPELTDHSESNIFVIIIQMFAAIAEMLGYYIDNVAEESFLATAQRRSSVIKHVKRLDYRIKARSPERVDITIIWNAPIASGFTISAGMRIDSIDGIRFISLTDVVVPIAATNTVVPVAQVTDVSNATFSVTNGQKNQKLSLGTNYMQSTLILTIDGEAYTEVTTFANSTLSQRHFIVDIEEDGNAYFVLGNGVKGLLENSALTIAVAYKTTLGATGKVGAGQFDDDTLVFNGALPMGVSVTSANSVFSSSGGVDYEATEDIRDNAIRSIRTLDRAVTRQDHVDILQALAAVGRAAIHFCCGKNIDLYIVPAGGGVASGSLIAEGQAEIDDKKMVATFPLVRPAGETRLVIIATVTAKKRKSISDTKTQVNEALIEFGSIANQEINGAVRLSDLQALIDNLENVDFVDISGLYTKPYARPVVGNHDLVWINETRAASLITSKWRIEFDGTFFRVFRDGVFLASVSLGAQYISPDNAFVLTIQAGAYTTGDSWEFNTYPYFRNIQLTDFTILTVEEADLFITVNAAPTAPVVTC